MRWPGISPIPGLHRLREVDSGLPFSEGFRDTPVLLEQVAVG